MEKYEKLLKIIHPLDLEILKDGVYFRYDLKFILSKMHYPENYRKDEVKSMIKVLEFTMGPKLRSKDSPYFTKESDYEIPTYTWRSLSQNEKDFYKSRDKNGNKPGEADKK